MPGKKKTRLKVKRKTMERRPEHDRKKPDLLKEGSKAVKYQGKKPRRSGSKHTRKLMKGVDL